MIFVKNSRGAMEVNMINTLSKINLSKIGWEGGRGVNLNLDNNFMFTVFLEVTRKSSKAQFKSRNKLANQFLKTGQT